MAKRRRAAWPDMPAPDYEEGDSRWNARSRTPRGDSHEHWETVERHAEKRGAKCQATYDQADALRKLSYNRSVTCGNGLIDQALQRAFTGPCKRANKELLRAFASCRRTGLAGARRRRGGR